MRLEGRMRMGGDGAMRCAPCDGSRSGGLRSGCLSLLSLSFILLLCCRVEKSDWVGVGFEFVTSFHLTYVCTYVRMASITSTE